jgi:hypothetical protein
MTPDDVLRIARVRGQAQAQILSEPNSAARRYLATRTAENVSPTSPPAG